MPSKHCEVVIMKLWILKGWVNKKTKISTGEDFRGRLRDEEAGAELRFVALYILLAIHFVVMGLLLWIKCIKNSGARLALSLTPHLRIRLKQGEFIFVKPEFCSQICLPSLTTQILFAPVVENLNFNEDFHKTLQCFSL